jgi:hypothetical protein
MDISFIIYTYESVNICHAYGPLTSGEADALETKLQAENPSLTIMKLPLETPPS